MKYRFYAVAATVLCGTLVLGGCVTNPFTRSKKVSPAAIDTGSSRTAGLAGSKTTTDMDHQETKLRKHLEQTGVNVARKGDTIHLNMPGNLTFTSGSHNMKPECYDVLNSLAIVLNEYKKTQVNISGHTDSVGKTTYNKALSKQRAQSIATYLSGQGVNTERFIIEGFGESQPIASNQTKYGRAMNRRVEIDILPIK
jgi:outer membrane protein OmpA-like peptidoglycan-associated protein